MNLADKVIEANDYENEVNTGPELDDIGFPLPKPDTEKAWCNYLTARLMYLNPRIYLHEGILWLEDTPIKENAESYYRLAKYPKKLKEYEVHYVWTKLKEVVPVLNTDIISILPGITFNMRTGEVKHEDVWTTAPWEEE